MQSTALPFLVTGCVVLFAEFEPTEPFAPLVPAMELVVSLSVGVESREEPMELRSSGPPSVLFIPPAAIADVARQIANAVTVIDLSILIFLFEIGTASQKLQRGSLVPAGLFTNL